MTFLQNFVKAIEGVYNSGVLESPVLDDVKHMIDLAYKNGDINESLEFMNEKHQYHMTKNLDCGNGCWFVILVLAETPFCPIVFTLLVF